MITQDHEKPLPVAAPTRLKTPSIFYYIQYLRQNE
jgi:hypothetical protein